MTIQRENREQQAEILNFIARLFEMHDPETGRMVQVIHSPERLDALKAGAAALSRQRENQDVAQAKKRVLGLLADALGEDAEDYLETGRLAVDALIDAVQQSAALSQPSIAPEIGVEDIQRRCRAAAERLESLAGPARVEVNVSADLLLEAASLLRGYSQCVLIAALVPQGWREMDSAPKDGEDVIIADQDGLVGHAFYNRADNVWCWLDMDAIVAPRAWQPMPAPPLSPAQET